MIDDLKLGMKLLRYTYGIKMNVGLLVICIVPDVLCFGLELLGIVVGVEGYFLLVGSMVPVQLVFTLNAVNSVLSSPARKRLQTSVPAVMTWCTTEGIYVIAFLRKLIIALVHPDRMEKICTQLVMLALIAAFIMACAGILYKYYIAILLMTTVLAFLVVFMIHAQWDFWGQGMLSLVCAALIGFVLITAGAAVEYGLSLLVYKKPVSKMSMGVQLRSQL